MKTYARWVVVCLAGLMFVGPLKFSTPVVVQSLAGPPRDWFEWLALPPLGNLSWPNQIGVIFAFGAFVWLVLDSHRMRAPVDWLFVLPLMFLLTQLLALPRSINSHVSADTVMHFATCALLFYAAAWYVRDGGSAVPLFGALGLAAMLTCVEALRQYAGGLQETRNFAESLALSDEFRARLASNRVFGTLVYPNSLAGFLVVAFAPMLAWLWERGRTWHRAVKWIALLFAAGLVLFTLVLTGSRGGFVAFAVMVVAGLWCMSRRRSVRVAIVIGTIALVLAGIAALGRGTRSLEARLDYWRGAVAIMRDHPWIGTGPGTFGSIYPKYKTADTEEAQLVHNNYLQMWCDSGVAGFVMFAALWMVTARDMFRVARERRDDAAAIAICAALAGWVVHGLVDFDLYVPGIAYPAFALLGALQGLKEEPRPDVVEARGRAGWPVAALCLVVVGAVAWTQGREMTAGFAVAHAYELHSEDSEAARAEVNRAITLAPKDAHYRVVAGNLAGARFDEAIEQYRAATELDPYRPSYHWRLGLALWNAHKPATEVLASLRRAAELNPTSRVYPKALAGIEESVRQAPPNLLPSLLPRNENLAPQQPAP